MFIYISVHTAALVALGVISVDMSHSIDWDAVPKFVPNPSLLGTRRRASLVDLAALLENWVTSWTASLFLTSGLSCEQLWRAVVGCVVEVEVVGIDKALGPCPNRGDSWHGASDIKVGRTPTVLYSTWKASSSRFFADVSS